LASLSNIDKSYKHFKRLREFVGTLIKYGFGDMVISSPLSKLVSEEKRENSAIYAGSRATRIKMVLQELGPSFVKFGQVLSNRQDLLPQDLIDELTTLQDNVLPIDYQLVKEIIESELKLPIDQIFALVNQQPLAAASIGQVHFARLYDDTDVVIKVQRPNIRKAIESDIEVMYDIARLAEQWIAEIRHLQPVDLVKAFEKAFHKETNFLTEAANQETFRKNFIDEPNIHVHKLYKEYCTEKVLVMEMVRGCKISQPEKMKEWGLNPSEIALKGIDLYFKQIFDFGFFHADPHPGNVLVLPNGKICFLDFGMVGRIPERDRKHIADILIGASRHNASMIIKAILAISRQRVMHNIADLERDLQEMIDEFSSRPMADISMGDFGNRLFRLIAEYQISIPTDYILLIRALVMVEGTGQKLNPDLNVLENASPYSRRLVEEKYTIGNIFEATKQSSLDVLLDMRDILAQAKEGELKLNVEFESWKQFSMRLDRYTSRISFSIVLSAMILSSALLVHSNVPPYWNGVPILAVASFAATGTLGLWLLYTIFKKGI
jgi:ubiquinone biosynthesis protein